MVFSYYIITLITPWFKSDILFIPNCQHLVIPEIIIKFNGFIKYLQILLEHLN